MSALELLLVTRRLRREIDTQALELGSAIEREHLARLQLRQTFVQRITSPLGLLSAAVAGFAAGKISAGPRPQRIIAHTVTNLTTLVLAAARAIGIQVALPMAIEWIQSKFAKQHGEENAAETKTKSDSTL